MKVSTFGKIGVSFGAAALIAGALVTPAQADPATGSFGTLVGVGSDTTQDVVNGLASAIGGGKVASYDAILSGSLANTVVTRAGGVAIARASGSGAGLNELRVATGNLSTASVALAGGGSATVGSEAVGQVDFARSSSGASATAADGSLVYVPFARDAVAAAVDPSGPLAVVPWILGTGATGENSNTTPSLYNVYRGTVKYVYLNTAAGPWTTANYVGVGLSATAPAGDFAFTIQPILPKTGSGTRSYFIGQLGFSGDDADTASWVSAHSSFGVKDTFTPAAGFPNAGVTTTPIEEHDGSAIANTTQALPANTYAIGPFSISQYVSQTDAVAGITSRTHGVILPNLAKLPTDTRVAPTTGSGSAIATNPSYAAMVRNVYNIVPSRQIDDATSLSHAVFAGSTSAVCSAASTITTYGFLTSPICGDTTVRAFSPSASSLNLTVPAAVVVGSTVSASATVSSFGNGGGTVFFKSGSTVLATASIAKTGTVATASFPTTAVGNVPVTATFVPKLDGVASSVSAAASISVASAAATASSTTITVPKLTVNKKAKVTVAVAGATNGGKITIKSGSTTLGTGSIAAGAATASVTITPRAITNKLVATFAPATPAVLGSSSAVKTVKAAKGTATIKVTAKKTKVTITVSGVVTPSGKVTVKDGSKTVKKAAKLSKGKVTLTLKKGTHKISVTYTGNSVYKSSKATVKKLKLK